MINNTTITHGVRRIAIAPRGATLLEAIVLAVVVVALVAAALPMLAAVSGGSGEARSMSNLQLISSACASYADTFGQRQFTAIPDDVGLVNGDCSLYLAQIACPAQQILGAGTNGAVWGYWLSTGLCAPFGYPGPGCANWTTYMPLKFTGTDGGFGSFRLPNVAAFNQFLDGRFYSDVWFSPNDRLNWRASALYRDQGIDFGYVDQQTAFSSYCLSPAAMFHPSVFGDASDGFQDPTTFYDGFISPAVTACLYPELKVRMVEHNWNLNPPSQQNSAVTTDAFYFNASSTVEPLAMFYDGSVRRVRNADAIADDAALIKTSGSGLWCRSTPFGADGYFGALGLDEPAHTSHTILTSDGILGRDFLRAR